jgi:hypothetical protein
VQLDDKAGHADPIATLHLVPTSRIDVHARRRNGTPAAGRQVRLRRPTESHLAQDERWYEHLRTDADGRATCTELSEGEYEVAVFDELNVMGATPLDWRPATVRCGTVHPLVFVLADVALLRGKVCDGRVPLEGARLQLTHGRSIWARDLTEEEWLLADRTYLRDGNEVWSTINTHTLADGTFELGPVAPGAWTLVTSHFRHNLSPCMPLELVAGENVFDVAFTAAELHVRFVDEDGRPWVDATAWLRDSEGAFIDDPVELEVYVECGDGSYEGTSIAGADSGAITDADGVARWSSLPQGRRFHVSLDADWAEPVEQEIAGPTDGERSYHTVVVCRRLGALDLLLEGVPEPSMLRLLDAETGALVRDLAVVPIEHRYYGLAFEESMPLMLLPGRYRILPYFDGEPDPARAVTAIVARESTTEVFF